MTFILKVATGSGLHCVCGLDAGEEKIHRRVGGSQLGNTAERNSLSLYTQLSRRSAALDAGRRQLH